MNTYKSILEQSRAKKDPWKYGTQVIPSGGDDQDWESNYPSDDDSEFDDFSGISTYTPAEEPPERAISRIPSRPSFTPTSTTMTMTPTMERPTMGAMPTYAAPKVSEKRLGELQRIAMGAPMARHRMGLSEALRKSGYSENPMVRAMEKEKALAGYGRGISDIRAGAQREAMAEYMPEYQAEVAKAGLEYQAGVEKTRAAFLADMQQYMGTMKKEVTERRAEPKEPYGRIPFRA